MSTKVQHTYLIYYIWVIIKYNILKLTFEVINNLYFIKGTTNYCSHTNTFNNSVETMHMAQSSTATTRVPVHLKYRKLIVQVVKQL